MHDYETNYAVLPYHYNFDFHIILQSISKWFLFFRFSNLKFECIYNSCLYSLTLILFCVS